jgi:hypothetical protein
MESLPHAAVRRANCTRNFAIAHHKDCLMIRKLPSGEYRLYSRAKNPHTGKRRNLGTFKTRAAAEKHEREVQYFKRQG